MKLRALAPAVAAAAALAVPSTAAAVQTSTLTYQCKYPLIGIKALSVKINLDVPDVWPASEPTAPFGVEAIASAYDMAAGLAAVDDLTSIKGTSTAFATVKTAQGFTVPAKTIATIAETLLPDPVPNPLVLTATGQTPSLTFDDPGTEEISLDKLAINLTALDSAGDPIPLPPVTKDIDGNKVGDSDGDPNTFDVYCKLDPGTQSTKIGSFQIYEGTPVPTPTPTAPPTATATPTTPPTPTPSPSPGPTVVPLPEVPSGTAAAPFQCKWPLLGVLGADFYATASAGATPGAPAIAGVWLKVPGGSFDAYPLATRIRGVIDAQLTAGGQTATTKLSVVASSISGEWGTTILYAEGPVPAGFAGGAVTVTKAAPNLIVYDPVGQPVLLPPLTRDLTGVPIKDSDGDPTTFDVDCNAGAVPPTPAPSPTATPAPPTPTPPPTRTPKPSTPPTPTPDPGPTQTKSLTYQCKWPLGSVQPFDLAVSTVLPPTVQVGSTRRIGLAAKINAHVLGAGLAAVDWFDAIEGTVRLELELVGPGGSSMPLVADLDVPKAPVPASDDTLLEASGSVVTPTFADPGEYRLRVTKVAGNFVASQAGGAIYFLPPITRDIAGNPTVDSDGLADTFDTSCAPRPAEQDTTIATTRADGPSTPAPTTGPTAKYSYALQGSTKLNTLTKGTMPLTGSVDASLALTTGNVTADLRLNDTQGRLTALGFLPVTATVGFVSSGPTTGKLVDDQLTTSSKVRIKVRSVKAFGVIPLAGGNNCQTKSLSDIALKSTSSFDPTGTGGTLAGTYAISDLNGCGPLNGLVSPITAGAGNTISVKLTPKN